MKVSVYKDAKGELSALIQASPGKGRPPMLLRGITLENVKSRVLPVVEAMRKPKGIQTTLDL